MHATARFVVGTILLSLVSSTPVIATSAFGPALELPALDPSTTRLDDDLLSSDGMRAERSDTYYGYAVTTVGDVNGDGHSDVLIGAPLYDNGTYREGLIFLYHGREDGLSDLVWYFDTNHYNCWFGATIAPAGDTNGDGYDDFIVGAPYLNNGQPDEGAVYLFAGGPGDPTLIQIFEGNEEGAHFGWSISRAGDVNGDGYDDILIGAPDWGGFGDPVYFPVQGRAFVYHGGPGGPDTTWDWAPLGGQEGMSLGRKVAGIGDLNADGYDDVMVSAPLYNPNDPVVSRRGLVRCYLGSSTGLSTSPFWYRTGLFDDDRLGSSLAAVGDVNGDGYADAIVGSSSANDNDGLVLTVFGGSSAGLAVQNVTPDAWKAGYNLAPAGDVNGDGFADALVGTFGDVAGLLVGGTSGLTFHGWLTGSPTFGRTLGAAGDLNDDGLGDFFVADFTNSQAYFYYGARPEWPFFDDLTEVTGDDAGELLASSVSASADVNGDGYDDLIVSAPGTGPVATGQVHAYFGRDTGIGAVPDWTVTGAEGTQFGVSVDDAGDVNGDGYSDVIVGEPGASRAHVYHGSSGGPSTTADWSYTFTEQADTEFGTAVSGAGDVNGDGFADIVISMPLFDGATTNTGKVRVFLGSPWGVRSTGYHDRVGFGWPNGGYGVAVAGAGDGDGDGFDEIVVGAPFSRGADDQEEAGVVYMYYGSADGSQTSYTAKQGHNPFGHLGTSVSGAGDMNGDGFADVVVSEPGFDSHGAARIYYGDVSPYHEELAWWLNTPITHTGLSLACAGDVNGDGRSEIAIGSRSATNGYVGFFGKVGDSYTYHPLGSVAEDPSTLVVTAGDLTGDGFPDAVLGLPYATSVDQGMFAAYAVNDHNLAYGHVGAWPRLETAAGDPIALCGRVEDPDDLTFRAIGRSAAGRTNLRLEFQLAGVGQSFDAPWSGPWSDSGPLAADPPELEAALGITLAEGERYRWRLRVGSSNPYFPHDRWMTDVPGAETLYGFVVGSPVVAVDSPPVAHELRIETLFPNPFRRSTTAELTVPRTGHVAVRVFDVQGHLVATLEDAVREAGRHVIEWDGTGRGGLPLAAGVYYLRAEAGDEITVRKILRMP